MIPPPSTTIAWPFTHCASGESSHTAASATSDAAPSCRVGDMRAIIASISGDWRRKSAVSVAPGQIALTRIPALANSAAAERVSQITPCLAAV